MAEEEKAQSTKPRKTQNIPVITFVLNILLKGFGIAIFSGFISVLIEFGLFYFSDTPVEDSYARFESVAKFKESDRWFNEQVIITQLQNVIIGDLKVKEKIGALAYYTNRFADRIAPRQKDTGYVYIIKDSASRCIKAIPDLILVWIIATFSWVAKLLGIVALLIPTLLIVIGGFIDGSVQRKIDTYRGIRDSQDKIEWWFYLFKASTYTVIFIYIAIPNSIESGVIMLPAAILSAFFCRNFVAHYKKYF